jgi:hypothetical protein
MTWTYNEKLALSRDRIRFYSGDTDTTDQLMSDEEIAFALSESGSNVKLAAALVCEVLAAEFARKADASVSDLSISYSQRYNQLLRQAALLRATASRGAIPLAGGISVSRVAVADEDTDRVEPGFKRGMLDNPEVTKTVYDEETE